MLFLSVTLEMGFFLLSWIKLIHLLCWMSVVLAQLWCLITMTIYEMNNANYDKTQMWQIKRSFPKWSTQRWVSLWAINWTLVKVLCSVRNERSRPKHNTEQLVLISFRYSRSHHAKTYIFKPSNGYCYFDSVIFGYYLSLNMNTCALWMVFSWKENNLTPDYNGILIPNGWSETRNINNPKSSLSPSERIDTLRHDTHHRDYMLVVGFFFISFVQIKLRSPQKLKLLFRFSRMLLYLMVFRTKVIELNKQW